MELNPFSATRREKRHQNKVKVKGPSSLLEERSEIPFIFIVSFVLLATSQTGGKRPRYI